MEKGQTKFGAMTVNRSHMRTELCLSQEAKENLGETMRGRFA